MERIVPALDVKMTNSYLKIFTTIDKNLIEWNRKTKSIFQQVL